MNSARISNAGNAKPAAVAGPDIHLRIARVPVPLVFDYVHKSSHGPVQPISRTVAGSGTADIAKRIKERKKVSSGGGATVLVPIAGKGAAE